LNRESQATSPAAENVLNLSAGFRPLPQTTRSCLLPAMSTLESPRCFPAASG
jgi:hypothetical protein